ncbi:hypothetical protein B566_EDAN001280 [Ephemera danica]|nr:hypothetical protein B566_EDAN001280 [Ephemera danica]
MASSSNQRLKESVVDEAWQSFANHILRLSDKIFDYYEGEQKEGLLEECKKNMISCCEMEEEYKNRKVLVEKTSAVMSEEDNERTTKDVYNEFKDNSKFHPKDGKKHQQYNNLLLVIKDAEKRVSQDNGGTSTSADDVKAGGKAEENVGQDEIGGEEDGEAEGGLQMTNMLVNTLDPITKKEMKEPVMSNKCPTPGCGWITANDIVPNLELKRIIDERRERGASRHARRDAKKRGRT